MWASRFYLTGALLIVLFAHSAAFAEPRRVLLLHSFGPHFEPWSAVAGRFREELTRRSPTVIDLYEASLETARIVQPLDEGPLVDYLRALFAGRNLDLVVAVGAPAARFFQKYRPQFFPSTPLLITAADQRTFNEAALTANDATVPSSLDLPKLVENILQVLPDTTNIAFVIGASRLEKFWVEGMRQAFRPFEDRVTFEWFNELSQDEMVKRAAARPPHSAIFYASVRVDVAGVPNEQDRVLTRLREAANAPIFSYLDSNFGRGIVGGPVISTQELGRKAAEVAVRILDGEQPGNIKTPPVGLGVPAYDWRELQRWGISESQLPSGSEVYFREPTMWQRYRGWMTIIFSALVLQSAMIIWFLVERLRRQRAEARSRSLSLEVMHLNRAAEAGALSASFAHDLGQPLVAISLNAQMVEERLKDRPELSHLMRAVADIRNANEHAVGIIKKFRKLLKRQSDHDVQETDINAVIADAVSILSSEANRRQVVLRVEGVPGPLLVNADPVHLLQVLLNLATNALDAMADTAPDARNITIRTTLVGGAQVEVSVVDSGPGIPEEKLATVFDTFYTTKEHGTGLGLSIARTIVDAYGGTIWAENLAGSGAAFRLTLLLIQDSWSRTVRLPPSGKCTNSDAALRGRAR